MMRPFDNGAGIEIPDDPIWPYEEILLFACCELLDCRFFKRNMPIEARKEDDYTDYRAVIVGREYNRKICKWVWYDISNQISEGAEPFKFRYQEQIDSFTIAAADCIMSSSKALGRSFVERLLEELLELKYKDLSAAVQDWLSFYCHKDKADYQFYSQSNLLKKNFPRYDYDEKSYKLGEDFGHNLDLAKTIRKEIEDFAV